MWGCVSLLRAGACMQCACAASYARLSEEPKPCKTQVLFYNEKIRKYGPRPATPLQESMDVDDDAEILELKDRLRELGVDSDSEDDAQRHVKWGNDMRMLALKERFRAAELSRKRKEQHARERIKAARAAEEHEVEKLPAVAASENFHQPQLRGHSQGSRHHVAFCGS